jgi:acetyltransferase-like isoleucine patch superfamily enzyme
MKLYSKLLKTSGMKINGIPRYIGINVVFDDLTKISLSDRVVISDECHFLTHDYSLTTALISIGEKPNGDVAFVNSIMI